MNWQKLFNLIGIGRITLNDDDGDLQLVQVTEGAEGEGFSDRVLDKVPRLTEFGFTSVAPDGAVCLVIRRFGERLKSIVVATSHPASRPKGLQPGDVCVYDVRGATVKFTSSGIVVDGAGQTVQVIGDLHVTGDVVSRSGGASVSLNTVHDKYNAHKHTGVSTGAGLSGTTDSPAT